MSRMKAARQEGVKHSSQNEKYSIQIKDGKRSTKRNKKRRRGCNTNEDSGSTSHDKNSTIATSKQIKISKDKYCLNPNISKLIRRSINEISQGQEKTVKLGLKASNKGSEKDEKKKTMETFNETI